MRMRRIHSQCTFEGCGGKVVAWGLCKAHDWQRRSGDVLRPVLRRGTRNRVKITGDTATIFLTDRTGAEAHAVMVDVADLPALVVLRWTFTRGYAAAHVSRTPVRKNVLLHRWLLQPADGVEVDHIDGDGLNNRRSNLRLVSHAQNHQNIAYRGREALRNVHTTGDSGPYPWRVRIQAHGDEVSAGRFRTEDEARDAAAALRATHFPFTNELRHR